MESEKAGDSSGPLQRWHGNVQIHPVDSLDLQGHVLSENFATVRGMLIFGSRTTPILRDRLPLRRPNSLARTACTSPPSTGAISRILPDAQTPRKYTLSV